MKTDIKTVTALAMMTEIKMVMTAGTTTDMNLASLTVILKENPRAMTRAMMKVTKKVLVTQKNALISTIA